MKIKFSKVIRLKVNVIARLEFEPAYYDVAVHHVCSNTTEITTQLREKNYNIVYIYIYIYSFTLYYE